METDKEIEEFERELNRFEVRHWKWYWRLLFILVIVTIIIGGYFLQ